ncbi:hypothetical protein BDY21DRAFT_65766 [Lineolata rhizophorae]|uniref:Uncharacterized protein n=1 Tax=Lineolata rhizophorae TaxID=578093 RepID=A0A6A6NX15_9PEZI|nr:hypothetical protein BDY21DRAFT_65766 [Lineolata rhizophorae]
MAFHVHIGSRNRRRHIDCRNCGSLLTRIILDMYRQAFHALFSFCFIFFSTCQTGWEWAIVHFELVAFGKMDFFCCISFHSPFSFARLPILGFTWIGWWCLSAYGRSLLGCGVGESDEWLTIMPS